MSVPRAAVALVLLLAACGSVSVPETTATPEVIAAGEVAFATHCAECHGTAATGTDQGPPLVDNIYRRSHHADIAISLAISIGVSEHHWNFGPMLPVEGVSDDEVAAIIGFVRHLQAEAGIE